MTRRIAIVAPPSDVGFDYEQLDVSVARDLRQTAIRVRDIQRTAVLDVGRLLIEAKNRVTHGRFAVWVERECDISIRGAERAMAAARMVEKNDKLSYLPPDGLLALSSRTAPEHVVAELIQKIEDGEKPSAAEIKHRLARETLIAKVNRIGAKPARQRSARERQELALNEHLLKREGIVVDAQDDGRQTAPLAKSTVTPEKPRKVSAATAASVAKYHRTPTVSASPGHERAKAIADFDTLLGNRLSDTLEDLGRLLRDRRERIAALPINKRVDLARGYLSALSVELKDLLPASVLLKSATMTSAQRAADK